MDNRLKFESHFNNVCGKLAKFNGLLFKGRNYFSKNVLISFFNSQAKPLISYGLIAIGATSKSLLEKIFVLQYLSAGIKTIIFDLNAGSGSFEAAQGHRNKIFQKTLVDWTKKLFFASGQFSGWYGHFSAKPTLFLLFLWLLGSVGLVILSLIGSAGKATSAIKPK